MTIDINEVAALMLEAIKNSVKDDWNLIKNDASTFLTSRKSRLELLASLRISNQINQQFFEARLADEKEILESELHAVAIVSKVVAQNAANAALDVLEKAILAALKTL